MVPGVSTSAYIFKRSKNKSTKRINKNLLEYLGGGGVLILPKAKLSLPIRVLSALCNFKQITAVLNAAI